MEKSPVQSYEYVLSRQPFVIQRRVRWSECDPAGVVYTGHFATFVLGAVNLFKSELAAGDYGSWTRSMQVDTPCKGMEYEFHAALWPEDDFRMKLTVPEVRRHSWDIKIEGTREDGLRVFTARFSPICIARDERRSAPVPDELRRALERYRG